MKKECIESIQTDSLVIKEITKKDSEKGDSQKSQKISEPTVIYNERKFSHECTRQFEGNQDSLNMYHRLNYGSKTDLILLQVLPHYSLKVNIGLYHFDNNTKFICSETLKASGNKNESNTEEVKTIFVNFTKINAENNSDKEYIQYYENMTYDITCKGIHSRWLLLNKDNMVLQIREELRINLNFNFNSNYSRLICIEYECKNFRDINTTVCTRRVRRDLNFLSYKYQSNDNNCNPGSGSIIAYIVLVGIILILLYFVLCRKFKKPRPPMPLPAEGTDSNHILYSVAYDHVVRRR
ncbi:uncharacterized protein LOC131850868 [Achroia grisella]|uniref:uncharacterized protein LOC131850868 n=1 Tax=Achroia grisella TaxID=688607 RepID=UPI0027D2FC08|nr:uncharacterized protein LOC131850868 [Achroia grisella]